MARKDEEAFLLEPICAATRPRRGCGAGGHLLIAVAVAATCIGFAGGLAVSGPGTARRQRGEKAGRARTIHVAAAASTRPIGPRLNSVATA